MEFVEGASVGVLCCLEGRCSISDFRNDRANSKTASNLRNVGGAFLLRLLFNPSPVIVRNLRRGLRIAMPFIETR